MKKIADHVFQQMSQQFETITAMDLRKQPGEVLDSVALGKIFLITKSGRPVAILSKPPGETLTIVVDSTGKVHYKR
jgi:hypothetical protein